jgi:hypothetical protein
MVETAAITGPSGDTTVASTTSALSPNIQFTVASEPTVAPQKPQAAGRVELVQVTKDTLYSF